MKKILIVDDEKDIRFILDEILTEHNYSTITKGTISDEKATKKLVAPPISANLAEERIFDARPEQLGVSEFVELTQAIANDTV